jgi:hypothetical protein
VIWTLPIASAVHESEELAFLDPRLVFEDSIQRLPRMIQPLIPRSRAQFAGWAVLDLGLTPVVSALASREDDPGPATRIFAVLVVFEALDVLDHLARWIADPRYHSGLVSSPIVSLPHSIWSLDRLLRDERIDHRFMFRTLAWTLPVSVLMVGAAILSRVLRRVSRDQGSVAL